MNQRIKKIKRQAFDSVWDLDKDPIGPSTHFIPDGFEEKFAKLIVAEMLQTCEDHPAWTGRMIGEQIKEHFGVEE